MVRQTDNPLILNRSIRSRAVFCAGMLSAAAAGLPAHAGDTSKPPNILLILADDLGWPQQSFGMDPEDSRSGCSYLETPGLDRLAREGMRFTDGYASAPICTPTRRSIQCGMTTARQRGTEFPSRFDPRKHLTIPQALKSVDPAYRCAHFGKWGEAMEAGPGEVGYDASDGITGNHTGDFLTWDEKFNPNEKTGGRRLPKIAAEPFEDPKLSFSVTERALEFMRRQVDESHPFFVQVSYYAVHDQIQARAETLGKYRKKGDPPRVMPPEFAAMVEDLDTCVGRLLDAINDMGIAGNTYVFFVSDNGGDPFKPGDPAYKAHLDGKGTGKPADGERLPSNYPLRASKQWLYEGGIRVPFLARGPGIEAGSVCREPVVTYDFLPTFYSLAGGKKPLPGEIDGGDIAPLLHQSGTVSRGIPGLVFHRPLLRFRGGKPIPTTPYSAYREGDLKLVYNWITKQRELFDLRKDVGETRDLSSERPEDTERMFQTLVTYLEAVDAEEPQPQLGSVGERNANWITEPGRIRRLKSLSEKAMRGEL